MAILPGPNEDFPFLIECGGKNCFFRVLTRTYAEAKRWDNPKQHGCPRGVDTMIGASLTLSLLEKTWQSLDAVVAEIMTAREKGTPGDDPQFKYLQGVAKGMGEVLATFMPPHFRTPEEVSREALRRWKCIQEGEAPETPGVGALKYTFPNDDKYKTMLAREAEKKALREKGKEEVSKETKDNILVCKGTFSSEQVANLYGVSITTVERIWVEG